MLTYSIRVWHEFKFQWVSCCFLSFALFLFCTCKYPFWHDLLSVVKCRLPLHLTDTNLVSADIRVHCSIHFLTSHFHPLNWPTSGSLIRCHLHTVNIEPGSWARSFRLIEPSWLKELLLTAIDVIAEIGKGSRSVGTLWSIGEYGAQGGRVDGGR